MDRQLTKERSAANTGLAKVAVKCSADTFVVKIATFANPENVKRHFFRQDQLKLLHFYVQPGLDDPGYVARMSVRMNT